MENNRTNFCNTDKKWNRLKETRRTYKGMRIHKVFVEDYIVNKIHKYGVISGVRL